jgi:hypothetical protein
MNADQFFYLLFCTITKREVFGTITYYYCDVLMYSLLFGLTMFAMPRFTMNSCMLYRDMLFVIIAIAVHCLYIISGNQMILFGNFGLYLAYLIADWKNDSLTHIGMKLCGKIKDDDSFEGDFPLELSRDRVNILDSQYEIIPDTIRRKQARWNRNLKNHEIMVSIWLDKLMKENNEAEPRGPEFTLEDFHRKRNIRMRWARAVYSIIFYLKYRIEQEKVSRDQKYQSDHTILRNMPMAPANAGNEDPDRIDEVSNEQDENDKLSEHARKTCSLYFT